MALSFAIEDKGILPDRMIAALAAAGGILPASRIRARPDPAGEPGSAAWRRRLPRARELPARLDHGGPAHRRIEAARVRARPTAPCWRPAASISCRCWKAWRCPRIFPPPPIRKARPAGSTCLPASSPTRRAASTASRAGYHGPLYAEISARARFRCWCAKARACRKSVSATATRCSMPRRCARCMRASGWSMRRADVSEGVAVGVDLSGLGPGGLVGYRAKRHTGLIDVERRGGYTVLDFWEPMQARPTRA